MCIHTVCVFIFRRNMKSDVPCYRSKIFGTATVSCGNQVSCRRIPTTICSAAGLSHCGKTREIWVAVNGFAGFGKASCLGIGKISF